jgi:DNA helicase-2/ATP-dependent DNA helicase PcrA
MNPAAQTQPKSIREVLLETSGHILVLGGPGSGKTYIAACKAGVDIRSGNLAPRQHILFLSFARTTVARVAEQANQLISGAERQNLEINTYHGFAWKLLRSHGYLLGAKQKLRLLPPPEAASRLSRIPVQDRDAEKQRLFREEGLLHFDLFAAVTADLLSRGTALTKIICNAYPIIVLDEFQDTNSDEWQMIKTLGRFSHLIALADAEQRIYEFRGADPKRLGEFITEYKPTQFDFGTENNRSNGTDIAIFGSDLLTGANKGKTYRDVAIIKYRFYRGRRAHFSAKTCLLQSIQRLKKSSGNTWAVAVLVPSKKLMLAVSDYLSSELDGLPAITHDVALDTEGPALAAVLIAAVLEAGHDQNQIIDRLVSDLCNHIQGRKGNDAPTKANREVANGLFEFQRGGSVRGTKKRQLMDAIRRIAAARQALALTGDPGEDWLAVRQLFAGSTCETLRDVADDAKYLRLLHKGALLRSRLGELWRTTGSYHGAEAAVRDALLQEHFSAALRDWKGIHVMTIHKAKGKEFGEVIIYEDRYTGRIVWPKAKDKDVAQARLTLRVGVTRGMKRTTILTPENDVCPFL